MMESDIYGRYVQCLTCGYLRDLEDRAVRRDPSNESDRGGSDKGNGKGLPRRRGPYRPRTRKAPS